MKKFSKVKRIFTILLIFLISINSFATSVGDNDGSAFITKAEFDSLKNNFQSQIDSYNQGIDSKIDGAIAAYLSGIKIDKEKNYKNVSGFDKYYFINKTLEPTFIVPSWHAIINHGGDSRYDAEDVKSFHINAESKYSQPANSECKRPLFGVISGSESAGITDLYWRGVALSYAETFAVAQTRYHHSPNMTYDQSYSYRGRFTGLHAIIAPEGYTANLSTEAVYAPVMIQQYYDGAWHDGTNFASNYRNNFLFVQTLVSLGIIGGKQTEYDHIGCYKGETMFTLSNETFLNTFRTHAGNTLKDVDVRNAVSTAVAGGFVGSVSGNGSRTNVTSVAYTDKNEFLRSIGMLKDDVAAKNIKQFNGAFTYSAQTNITVPNCNLKDGLILAYGEAGNIIEWDVDISKVTINNGSSDVVNSNEVDIYVSYVPFSDMVTSTKYVRLGTTTDYATTSGRKLKLSWTASENSLFYVKMVPHFTGTSYINNPWEIELNLDGNAGDYTIISDV